MKKTKKHLKTKYFKLFKKHKNNLKYKKNINIIFFIILIFLGLLFIWILILLFLKLTLPLPDVKGIKNLKVAQSSIIYDRYWGELYKIYSEKRTYVKYSDISKNMINAIVAWEDQRFWITPWFDTIGIIRAIIEWLKNHNHFSWTSWITQQLAKITYLTNERSIERKIKELYLSIKLNESFSKEEILELYLNKIFFWWNSYWVEQASITFFGKKSSELSVLESSILASLPKAPTNLSPYSNKEKLLGYPSILNKNDNLWIKKILSSVDLKDNIDQINELKKFINNLKFSNLWQTAKICGIEKKYFKNNDFILDDNWCVEFKFNRFLDFLNSIYIEWDKNIVKYNTWRKDYILYRMLEDKYITFDKYKKAIISSFWFEFRKYEDKIKYPYFVMFVKKYLALKYWEDLLKTWWLKIYTTIDPKLQDKAEEIIKKQVKKNKKYFNASNAALVSLDSKTSEILAMVWWVDYFDKNNLWYNNIITSRLQPGSTFKPFIYALAMIRNNYTAKTIVTDDKFVFPWWYKPNNADLKFMWKMTLAKALDYSRNIPAIKMYYAAWSENEIIKKLKYFWMHSLEEFKKEYKKKYGIDYYYSAPMALWTVEITPLELAWAYTVFANNWIKNKIIPIRKIINSKWEVLEELKVDNIKWKRIISKEVSFRINSILSNPDDRPKWWNPFLLIPDRKIAVKTWTSSKEYLSKKWIKDENWKLYQKKIVVARNLWTIWYTPQITTVVWAWNNSWKELSWKAYWLTWAGPIMRDFMTFAHEGLEVEKWIK